jgi:hypothetical protein
VVVAAVREPTRHRFTVAEYRRLAVEQILG